MLFWIALETPPLTDRLVFRCSESVTAHTSAYWDVTGIMSHSVVTENIVCFTTLRYKLTLQSLTDVTFQIKALQNRLIHYLLTFHPGKICLERRKVESKIRFALCSVLFFSIVSQLIPLWVMVLMGNAVFILESHHRYSSHSTFI